MQQDKEKGVIDLNNLPLYTENDPVPTIRVSGGSQYFGVACYALETLKRTEEVDLAFIGSAAAWQAALALGIIFASNSESVSVEFMYVRGVTSRGTRKYVVARLRREGEINRVKRVGETEREVQDD